jgi:cytochrome c-type biogenesis protein CcmE
LLTGTLILFFLMTKKKPYWAGTLIIVGAIGTLLATSMKSSALRAVPVSEICAADHTKTSFVGQTVRIVGWVSSDKVRREPVASAAGNVLVSHFSIVDEKKAQKVRVSFRDALPDTFRPGSPVQVDGLYKAAGEMQAERVLTKCPSKYEAGEPGGEVKGAAGGTAAKEGGKY